MNLLIARLSMVVGMTILSLSSLQAQTSIWNNGGGDSLWDTASNWTGGVPGTSSTVQIGSQPSLNTIDINTGAPTTIASLTFNSTLSASASIVKDGTETLQVNGAITNLSSFNQNLSLLVIAGANATYAGGSGLTFSQLTLNSSNIATTGTIDVTQTLVFSINSTSSFGQIGSVDVAGATINIGSSGYTAQAGDTFDFTTGNFSGAAIGTLPTLSGGLSWNTSQFLSQGILEVVPEPSDTGLLALGLCLLGALSAFPRLRQRLLPASSR